MPFSMVNITARALIFPLAHDCFLSYDVDPLCIVARCTANEALFVNTNMARAEVASPEQRSDSRQCLRPRSHHVGV